MTRSKVLEYLGDAFKQGNMFESIMFEGKNEDCDDVVEQISRMLYCQNHSLADDACQECKKFKNKQIGEFNLIGDHVQSISKNTILEVISKLNFTSTQHLARIVIIANAEDLKTDAANALLKSLEEPLDSTYFFLITNDRNAVLPTIKSRVKIINISENLNSGDEDNFLIQLINKKNPNNLFLLNNKLKKLSSEQLKAILENGKSYFLKHQQLAVYELFLELLNYVEFHNNVSLAIDRFLIEIARIK